MPKALTPAQCRARATVLEECADHLGLMWTDDAEEWKQGKIVSEKLRVDCERYRIMANEQENLAASFDIC